MSFAFHTLYPVPCPLALLTERSLIIIANAGGNSRVPGDHDQAGPLEDPDLSGLVVYVYVSGYYLITGCGVRAAVGAGWAHLHSASDSMPG